MNIGCYCAVLLMCCLNTAFVAAQAPVYDLLLAGGHVIDPANGRDGIMDVAVSGGRIARVEPSIPSSLAKQTVDVTGYYVTPGLIDIHTHVFSTAGRAGQWVYADHFSFQSCVTTMVDAGTAGADNFEEFARLIAQYKTRVFAFLNIAAPGKGDAEQDARNFDIGKAVAAAKRYPGLIVGFKSASYLDDGRPYDAVNAPWASVDSVLAAGRRANLPVMISFNPQPASASYPARTFEEFLNRLRPGDIVANMYAPRHPFIDEQGSVDPAVLSARRRGVFFECAQGSGSFVYANAVPSIEQGFLPDAIGSDLHGAGRMAAVVDFMTMMSRLMACGMDIEQAVAASTIQPARIIGHPELGTLTDGAAADIAVFRIIQGEYSFRDTGGNRIRADMKLEAAMTVSEGRIVWDPWGLSGTVWKPLPK